MPKRKGKADTKAIKKPSEFSTDSAEAEHFPVKRATKASKTSVQRLEEFIAPSATTSSNSLSPIQKLELVNAPDPEEYCTYFTRTQVEPILQKKLVELCNTPEKGFFGIEGYPGVGKTSLVSHVLRKISYNTDALIKPTIVFWINCSKWQSESLSKESFDNEILQLAKLYDPTFCSCSLASVIPFFKNKGKQLMFVLDDVTSVIFLQNVTSSFKSSAFLCCVITISSISTFTSNVNIHDIFRVEKLTYNEMLAMLGNSIRTKLSNDQLNALAKLRKGHPLTASLVISYFNMEITRGNRLCNSCFDEVVASLRKDNRKTMASFLRLIINGLPDSIRQCLSAFLYFEPGEPVLASDIAFFWDPSDVCKDGVIEKLLELSLVTPSKWFGEQRLVLHQLIFEDAVQNISEDLNIKGKRDGRLEEIRIQLLKRAVNITKVEQREQILFEAVRRGRLFLCERFIETFSAENLMKLCKEHSTNPKDQMNSSFLHFLYHNAPIVDSCRMIAEIIRKLKRFRIPPREILEIINCKPRAGDSWTTTLLDDVMGETGHEEHQFYEKKCLIMALRQWRWVHDKHIWLDTVLVESQIDPLIKAIVLHDEEAFLQQVEEEKQNQSGDEVSMRIVEAAGAAAYCGNKDFLVALYREFGEGAISQNDSRDKATIIYAAENGYLEMIKMLSEIDEDFELQVDDCGRTPLMLAAAHGYIDAVKLLAELEPTQLSHADYDGRTPIIYAGGYGHLDVLKFILDASDNAELSESAADGVTVISVAAQQGHYDVVEFIGQLDNSLLFQPDGQGMTPMMLAAENGHLDIVKMIVECQHQESQINRVDKFGQTSIMFAAEKGHVNVVKYLVDAKYGLLTQKDFSGLTAAMFAAKNRHTHVLKFIADVEKNALSDSSKYGMTAIMFAAENGDLESVTFLAELDKSLISQRDSQGRSAVTYAARNGWLHVMKFFVDLDKTLPSHCDNHGITPAMEAVIQGHTSVTRFLIENDNAELLRKDEDGRTIVSYAAIGGHVELLTFIASVNIEALWQTDNIGATALLCSSGYGHCKAAEFLIEKGADADARDGDGDNCLIAAVSHWRHMPSETESNFIIYLLDKCSEETINRANLAGLNATQIAFNAFNNGPWNDFHIQFTDLRNKLCLVLLQAGGQFSLDPFEFKSKEFPWASVSDAVLGSHCNSLFAIAIELRRKNSFHWGKFVRDVLKMDEHDLPQFHGVQIIRHQFPRTLQASCRTVILNRLPVGLKRRRMALNSLQLPEPLKQYLNFIDIETSGN